MVASNKQPSGSKPGPGTVHTHGPNAGGKPSPGFDPKNKAAQGVGGHGTPKPVGNGKRNPLH